MLRKIRVILGLVFFVLITLLLLDFTGVIHRWFGWLAKIQLVPAILSTNLFIVAGIIVLTLLFGRVYCSVICPLGVMQDGVNHIAGRFKKKNRFSYSRPATWLRYGVLGLFVALAIGVHWAGLIEPYSIYGRGVVSIFGPLYRLGNNLLAFIAERVGSYAIYPVEVYVKSWLTLILSLVMFLIVGYLAWRRGRTYCNTICPVGTALGLISRFSIFKPVMDPEKCTKCSLCAKNCKASCIDYKNYSIDHSRCVACMNCLDKCKFDALHYTAKRPVRKPVPISEKNETLKPEATADGLTRRGFLSVAAIVAAAQGTKAQQVIDGGLAEIIAKKRPERETPVLPPGAVSARHINSHCTACQLCVSACPNNIMVPSTKMQTFMQPELTFERGYCRPECTRCGEVCPAGAIGRITPAEKSATQIGRAVWISENCIVNRDEEICTACQRHCPTGAIELVARDSENALLKIPVIDTERCIGCGACEHLCPSRPLSAIYVEGITRHRIV